MKKRIILEAMFEIFLVISLIFVFGISNAPIVKADDNSGNVASRVCCQKATIDGESKSCQYTDKSNCDSSSGIFDNKCEDVSVCKPVCCNVNSLGYYGTGGQGCFKSVSRNTCANELHGQVILDTSCNVPECNRGCCSVGSQCTLTTQENCQNLTATYPNLQMNYNPDVNDELTCLNSCRSALKGCCVTSPGSNTNCKSITYGECTANGGQFYEGTSCTDLPAGTTACDQCKYGADDKNKKLGCATNLDGGEKVYEYDKCGNPNKVADVTSDGVDGNCDYSAGTICREENGTASCKSLNCAATTLWDNPYVDEDGNCPKDAGPDNSCWTDDNKLGQTNFNTLRLQTNSNSNQFSRDYRINGESWCEYDSNAGPGKDLPGTRHYVHTCYEGKEVVQECKDYRNEYCIQFIGAKIDQASCLPNKAVTKLCSTCDNDKTCCEAGGTGSCLWVPLDTSQCVNDAKKVCEDVDKNNNITSDCTGLAKSSCSGAEGKGKCLPLVPPGTKDKAEFCKSGDGTFTASWVKFSTWFSYGCESGCDLYTNKFAYQQNNYCGSLGDCGAKYNLAGEWSGSSFSRSCAIAPLNPDDDLSDVNQGGKDFDIDYGKTDNGASQLVNNCKEQLPDPANYSSQAGSFADFSRYTNILRVNSISIPGLGIESSKIAAYVIGAVGVIGAITILIVSAVYSALFVAGAALAYVPIVGWIIDIAIIAAAVWIYLAGDTKDLKIDVACKPWAPPIGNKNCDLCDKAGIRTYLNGSKEVSEPIDLTANGLHKCTPYLCWSLGQGCKFVSTDDDPKCIAQDCTPNAPKRSPLSKLSELNKGSCRNGNEASSPEVDCTPSNPVTDTGHGGYDIKYVKENTNIIVGIETDKLAVCKWDWNKKVSYDDLTKYFDQTQAATVHTITLKADTDLTPGINRTMNIICKDTCGNPTGGYPPYTIHIEVSKMKDIGAPAFVSIDPPSGTSLRSDLINNATGILLKLNKPSSCKWSKTNDPYDLMKGLTSNCDTPTQGCSLTLTDIQQGVNNFFIRCKSKNNVINVDAIPSNDGYKLIRSQPLNISSIRCINSVNDKCEIIYDNNFTLEVITTNGKNNGKSVCSAFSSNGLDYEFFNTGSSISTQVIGPRNTGTYTENIKCADDVNLAQANIVTAQVNFTMIHDTTPPKILKVNFDSDHLYILTDEVATCKFGDSSSTIYSDMISFENTGSTLHSTIFKVNYLAVKCSDRFNNIASFDVYRSGKPS